MLPRRPSHEEILKRAYFRWQEEGCPDGRDWEFWFDAEDALYFEYHRMRRLPMRQVED
jgi:hypothetical protein